MNSKFVLGLDFDGIYGEITAQYYILVNNINILYSIMLLQRNFKIINW